MIDVGLFLMRLVVGALVAAHGLQKLTGWFGGPGLAGTEQMLGGLHYRHPRVMARVLAITETTAGLLLVLGLAMPLAAAGIAGVMLNAAVVVHRTNGLWVQDGGYEYNLVLATLTTGLSVIGGGAWSLDHLFGWDTSGAWALLGPLVGLTMGQAVMTWGRRQPTADQRHPTGRPTVRTA